MIPVRSHPSLPGRSRPHPAGRLRAGTDESRGATACRLHQPGVSPVLPHLLAVHEVVPPGGQPHRTAVVFAPYRPRKDGALLDTVLALEGARLQVYFAHPLARIMLWTHTRSRSRQLTGGSVGNRDPREYCNVSPTGIGLENNLSLSGHGCGSCDGSGSEAALPERSSTSPSTPTRRFSFPRPEGLFRPNSDGLCAYRKPERV
jgi:hypothetical protein